MCSILGFAAATPAAQGLTGAPMLLGRTSLAAAASEADVSQTLSEMKNRAATARTRQALRAFLLASGFAEVNARRATGIFRSGFSFPLHTAVTANNAEMVAILLSGGADRSRMDSRSLTPLALARQLDKQGSHSSVMALLED